MNGDDQALIEIKADIKLLRKDVNDLLSYEKFKKEAKDNMFKYIRAALLLGSVGMGMIGWLAYETGLYKPIPTHKTEQK